MRLCQDENRWEQKAWQELEEDSIPYGYLPGDPPKIVEDELDKDYSYLDPCWEDDWDGRGGFDDHRNEDYESDMEYDYENSW